MKVDNINSVVDNFDNYTTIMEEYLTKKLREFAKYMRLMDSLDKAENIINETKQYGNMFTIVRVDGNRLHPYADECHFRFSNYIIDTYNHHTRYNNRLFDCNYDHLKVVRNDN